MSNLDFSKFCQILKVCVWFKLFLCLNSWLRFPREREREPVAWAPVTRCPSPGTNATIRISTTSTAAFATVFILQFFLAILIPNMWEFGDWTCESTRKTGKKTTLLCSSDPDPDPLFWHNFWHTTWKSFFLACTLTFFLAFYLACILTYLLAYILIGILSGILCGISSDILSHVLSSISSEILCGWGRRGPLWSCSSGPAGTTLIRGLLRRGTLWSGACCSGSAGTTVMRVLLFGSAGTTLIRGFGGTTAI